MRIADCVKQAFRHGPYPSSSGQQILPKRASREPRSVGPPDISNVSIAQEIVDIWDRPNHDSAPPYSNDLDCHSTMHAETAGSNFQSGHQASLGSGSSQLTSPRSRPSSIRGQRLSSLEKSDHHGEYHQDGISNRHVVGQLPGFLEHMPSPCDLPTMEERLIDQSRDAPHEAAFNQPVGYHVPFGTDTTRFVPISVRDSSRSVIWLVPGNREDVENSYQNSSIMHQPSVPYHPSMDNIDFHRGKSKKERPMMVMMPNGDRQPETFRSNDRPYVDHTNASSEVLYHRQNDMGLLGSDPPQSMHTQRRAREAQPLRHSGTPAGVMKVAQDLSGYGGNRHRRSDGRSDAQQAERLIDHLQQYPNRCTTDGFPHHFQLSGA